MTDYQLVVMRKHGLVKQGSGVVSIAFTLNPDTRKLETPSPQDFPTGAVWISSGYDDICQKFEEGELFLLTHFSLIDKQSESYLNARDDNKHDHWAMGNAAKKLEPSWLIPVVKAPLPDIGSGRIDYSGEIPTGPFFIQDNSYVVGPFTATRSESDIIATPSSGIALSLKTYHVARIGYKDLYDQELYLTIGDISLSRGINGYISSLKDIFNKIGDNVEQVDYINDTQLITYFVKNGFGNNKNPLAKKHAEQLKAAIAEERRRKAINGDNERVDRLTRMLDHYLQKADFGKEIIDSWLSSQVGKDFLEKLVKENPKYIEIQTEELTQQKDQLTKELEAIRADKRRAEQDVLAERMRIVEARNQADKEIDNIRQRTREEQERERTAVLADLERRIQEKKNDLDASNTKLDEILAQLEMADKVKNLKGEVEFRERRKEELDRAVTAQKNLLRSPNLLEEAIKTQSIIDLIQGRRFNMKEEATPYQLATMADPSPETGESIIEALTDRFDEGGRSFTFEEMANLQVAIQQSFMTVLKGLPGAGKTSTAIRLAQAHYIADENGRGDNFLNIPASRGWVSSRDFVGFYNALKGVYQPAKTGLYQFLRHGSEPAAASTLRLVLLDEGNLSPMEHYMSDFLGMFDSEGRHRPLDTGMPDESLRYLYVPDNIRFIATINNDHTTEPLSPRLCDRVPIISMDTRKLPDSQPYAARELNGAIPYAKMEEFFGIPNKEARDTTNYEDLPPKLSRMLALFEEQDKSLGQVIIVSKRKRLAMQAYCTVASRYMTETLASDFAVAQYMLPLINGFGKPFKDRLEKIAEHAARNSLAGSTEVLESIIHSGESHVGSYSFF